MLIEINFLKNYPCNQDADEVKYKIVVNNAEC